MTGFHNFPSQGQRIAPGWDNVATLKNVTAYLGADGSKFLPVEDRKGYTGGIEREMPTGGILLSGMPAVRWVSPWISDGQLYYLKNTLLSGMITGNVTIATHIPGESIGATATFNFNAEFNLRLNQLQNLDRKGNGYREFVWEFKIVEVL